MKTMLPFILTTGFMGAGKTTVAAALSKRVGCRMIDLDQFITERLGRTPQAIIDESGEPQFRAAETLALSEILERKLARIIALGGGTWTLEQNRALILEHEGFTVWLDAPFEMCWQRIGSTGGVRPLARERETALRLFQSRRALYELAHLRVQINEEKCIDEIVAEIETGLPQ